MGIKGEYKGVSAIIIPSLCDSLKTLGQNWKYAVADIPFIPVSYTHLDVYKRQALGISPIILGLIVVVTLALGLVTPPYGLCLLLAGSISGISIEDSFKGVLPYFLSSLAVLVLMMVFSDVFLAIPMALFPNLF